MNSDRQLIVSGFHRSGTSMTMQALVNAGLVVGEDLVAANPSNPDGHFEDQRIVRLHDRMLEAQQRHWYTAAGPLAPVAPDLAHEAQQLIASYRSHTTPWGFKDPRTCLLLDQWFKWLPQPGAVLVYRDYLACYRSLRQRQAQTLAYQLGGRHNNLFFWRDSTLALRLWIAYNEAVIDFTQRHRDAVVLVSCEALLEGFDLVGCVNRKLGLSLAHERPSGIRRALQRSSGAVTSTAEWPLELSCSLQQTLRTLNDLADAPLGTPTTTVAHASVLPHDNSPALWRETAQQLRQITDRGISVERPTSRSLRLFSATQSAPCEDETERFRQQVCRLIDLGELAKAKELLDSAIQIAADDVRALVRLGKLAMACACYDAAETALLAARQAAPRNLAPVLHLALLARESQLPRRSAVLFDALANRQADQAGSHHHLARGLATCDRPAAALACCRRTLELDPGNNAAATLEIRLLLNSGQLALAEQRCRQHLRQWVADRTMTDLLVQILIVRGDTDAAMQAFYRAIQLRLSAATDYLEALSSALASITDPLDRRQLHRCVNEELQRLRSQVSLDQPLARSV